MAALVAEGLSNGEIGRRLYISTKTASVHVSSILRKLAMSNRSEIAAWAVRNGIVVGNGTSASAIRGSVRAGLRLGQAEFLSYRHATRVCNLKFQCTL